MAPLLKSLKFSPTAIWRRLVRLAFARGYRLGLAAGRRSFLLNVHHCKPGEPVLRLISNAQLVPLMGVFNHMHLTIGEVSLLIQDTMPHVETYPDQDEDEPDTWRPAGHPHAQGRAVDILGPDGSITHLTGK